MKVTREFVSEYIKDKGYIPVQIDTIPEGFSFKEPDITIGGVSYEGEYVAFIPLENAEIPTTIKAITIEGLKTLYKLRNHHV